MKKFISLFLSIILTLSVFIPYTASAQVFAVASSGVISVEMSTFPNETEYNTPLTFTVVTDTNTSKVKIQRSNGDIFTIANTENGFLDYTDNGSQRTWVISRPLQVMLNDDFIISAGNSSYDYSSEVMSVLKNGTVISGKPTIEEASESFIEMMGAGWNLGNTLDAHGEWIELYTDNTPTDYETAWGKPVTTKAMIDTIKEKGFKTLRVPTTWAQHLDENNIIDADWMARVKEVVDYGIDNGMYVILNIHHEESYWLSVDGSKNYAQMEATLTAIWTQISNEFADYNKHLIFEVMNEPRNYDCDDEWTGNASSYALINDLNAAALETIRSTGGNNATRLVMLPTYAASSSAAPLDAMVVPDDENVIISVHAYTPYSFCTDSTSAYTSSVESTLDKLFERLKEFRDAHNNVPMVLGEFGCHKKDDVNNRILWMEKYVSSAKALDIPCVIWDNGNDDEFCIFNRSTLTWNDEEYVDTMLSILNS